MVGANLHILGSTSRDTTTTIPREMTDCSTASIKLLVTLDELGSTVNPFRDSLREILLANH